jgi:hypothetical protein
MYPLIRAGVTCIVLSSLSGCTRSIQLTLRADISDGATGVASIDFESHTIASSEEECFAAGVCEMVIGPADVDSGPGAELLAWADPENDDWDHSKGEVEPEPGEPTAATTVDLPKLGVFRLTLDLE